MANDWVFQLFVKNHTGKKLSVISHDLYWGNWEVRNDIPADESVTEVLRVRAASGTWTGYTFDCIWGGKDGSISLVVDVPFSADNKGGLTSSGLFEIDGWDGKLPYRGHHFVKTVELSIVGGSILAESNDSIVDESNGSAIDEKYEEYYDHILNASQIIQDFEKVKSLKEIKTFNFRDEIPKDFEYPPNFIIGRSHIGKIGKENFAGLGDPLFKTIYQKEQFVEDYFVTKIFTIDTDLRTVESILPGQSTVTETSVEVTSSIKTILENNYSLKTSLSAEGIIAKIAAKIAANIQSEFHLNNLKEESYSKIERTNKIVTIEASEKHRIFVQWMFSSAFVVYRKRKNREELELIAVSEWPITLLDEVYNHEH